LTKENVPFILAMKQTDGRVGNGHDKESNKSRVLFEAGCVTLESRT
jgi:hypothetical protein